MSETSLNELKINYLTEEQYNNAKNSGNINNNELYMTPDDGNNGEGGIIVSPTEPQTDRRKVWFQKGTDTNAIYVKNDNGEYEEFIKKEEQLKKINCGDLITLKQGYSYKNANLTNPVIVKYGEIVEINLLIEATDNIPTTLTTIAKIDNSIAPKRNVLFSVGACGSFNNGWSVEGNIYGLIDPNGNIEIRNTTGTNYKYALIHLTYIIGD